MIKSFIYLDEYKMYSLSSQVFEGITDYLINTKSNSEDHSEDQKGPIGSGRILADIISKEHGTMEKKYLHDYSYVLFEKHLLDKELVLSINSLNEIISHELIERFPFIKIKGKATFNDMESIKYTLGNFNTFGQALTYVTNYQEIENARQQLEQTKKITKDRNQKSVMQSKFKRLANIENLAKESGLQQDQKFMKDLDFLLSYGFQDQFEIQIEYMNHIFSANLKRDALREKEDLLIRKYSRKTEVEFIIFGMATQYPGNALPEEEEEEEVAEHQNIKEAVMNLFSHLCNVENSFTGRLSNEIVIDPIAVYIEL